MIPWWKNRVAGLVVFSMLGSIAWAVDSDLDGVDDELDICCGTPAHVPVDEHGRPIGDLDLDCDVDLLDAAMFWESFTGPLPTCNDEDECFLGTHNCHLNATCTDTPGGFTCMCMEGYTGNGVQCQDINECASDPCAGHGACSNFPGGYTCTCNPGYVENNGTCSDINECDEEGLCGDAGVCVNQPGLYSCTCNPGYANCDADPGCEVQFASYSNSCSTALFVGSACGDLARGFLCPGTNYFQFNTAAGRGSKWFRAHVEECSSSCCSALEHRYRLTVPAGIDYDLYVYGACNGALVESSTNGAGQLEVVTPSRNDDCGGADNGGDFLIEVRYDSGSSCAEWTLTFEGRD